MIHITLNHALHKGLTGHSTCGITPDNKIWAAPAAKEVAP